MKPLNKLISLVTVTSTLGLLTAHVAADEKAPFDPSGTRQAGLGTPTPLDKMIALDQVLGKGSVDWKGAYNEFNVDVDADDFSDKEVTIPAFLGIRISDGVVAIKARDAEKLNAASEDIEALAAKLGVPQGKLDRARKVRKNANEGKWAQVFLELGFLQADVMKTLDEDGNKERRAILISAGWLQGARIISGIVSSNYSSDSAGLVREPMLVKNLQDSLGSLKGSGKDSSQVKVMSECLAKVFPLLDIPMHASPSEEDIKTLKDATDSCIKKLVEEAN